MSVTVALPDELAARAASIARSRGVTIDDVVSELVKDNLPEAQRRRRLGFVGVGSSTSDRTSEDIDDMLAEGFGRG